MTVTWRSRAQWGAMSPRSMTPRALATIDGVTIHHSTGATLHHATDVTNDQWVRRIQRAHMSGANGETYSDIAYNALVDGDGTIYEGRRNDRVGAHAKSSRNVANRTTLGLCILGNGDTITAEQIEAVRAYLYVVVVGLHVRPLRVFGHRDWARLGGTPTYCPSDRVELLARGWDHVAR